MTPLSFTFDHFLIVLLDLQNAGVTVGEARADRDHRCQGFSSYSSDATFVVTRMSFVIPLRDSYSSLLICSQAKEVRRVADRMVQLGKEVRTNVVGLAFMITGIASNFFLPWTRFEQIAGNNSCGLIRSLTRSFFFFNSSRE